MNEPPKVVNFYKLALQSGFTANLRPDEELNLVPEDCLRPAAYLTRRFDTGSAGCTYNRLKVEGRFENARLEVIVAATDSTEALINGEWSDMESCLQGTELEPAEKTELLKALPHVRGVDSQDLLLHDLRGRYVWVYVRIFPTGESDCSLAGMRLEFPMESFTQYFPEIYREDAFFERYIALLQSLYMDIETKVDNLPRLLDYQSAPDEQLKVLAGWLGLDVDSGHFDTSMLRHMIRNIDLFQGKKGTRAALEAVLRLATGRDVRIVEWFDLAGVPLGEERRKLYRRLYGESESGICVILDLTDGSCVDRGTFDRLIRQYTPIGVNYKLICLESGNHLDMHCYMGINSSLSAPSTATVDGSTLGGYFTVG